METAEYAANVRPPGNKASSSVRRPSLSLGRSERPREGGQSVVSTLIADDARILIHHVRVAERDLRDNCGNEVLQ